MKRDQDKTSLEKTIDKVRPTLWISFLFSFFTSILMLFLPFFSLLVLDKVLGSRNTDTLFWLIVVAAIAFTFLGLIGAARTFIYNRVGEWMDEKMTPELLGASVANSAIVKSAQGSAVMRDFSVIKTFITGPVLTHLMDLPWSFLFIVIIYLIHPYLGLVTIVGAVILLTIAWLNERATKKVLKEANNSFQKSMKRSEAATRNAEVIQAMGMMPQILNYEKSESDENRNLQKIAGRRNGIWLAASKILRLFIQIAIISVGALLVLDGNQISVGSMIAASIINGRALAPFEMAIGWWRTVINANDSYKRVNGFLQTSPKKLMGTDLPKPQGKLTVEKVFYRPPGAENPNVKGVNFTLEPGESLGLIGPSAAGKSSIAKLILGIWKPLSGSVRLDGADVYTWKRENFGQYVGYLPQEVELFAGTIKANIARMHENPDDKDIIEAAQYAGVHDMILRFPAGYDTDIGEFGSVLSSGQRQRIGLARAIYKDPKLLVLDEPNANLDNEGEKSLLRCLNHAKEQKITTILIAHKPSILSFVNKVAVIKDGQLFDFGARDNILPKYVPSATMKQIQRNNGQAPKDDEPPSFNNIGANSAVKESKILGNINLSKN